MVDPDDALGEDVAQRGRDRVRGGTACQQRSGDVEQDGVRQAELRAGAPR